MAIEFIVDENCLCPDCNSKLICVNCEYDDGAVLMPITPGERDVVLEVLEHTKEQQLQGKVRMSAVDCVDLDTILQKVRNLL